MTDALTKNNNCAKLGNIGMKVTKHIAWKPNLKIAIWQPYWIENPHHFQWHRCLLHVKPLCKIWEHSDEVNLRYGMRKEFQDGRLAAILVGVSQPHSMAQMPSPWTTTVLNLRTFGWRKHEIWPDIVISRWLPSGHIGLSNTSKLNGLDALTKTNHCEKFGNIQTRGTWDMEHERNFRMAAWQPYWIAPHH